jgi:hypothetical protein
MKICLAVLELYMSMEKRTDMMQLVGEFVLLFAMNEQKM